MASFKFTQKAQSHEKDWETTHNAESGEAGAADGQDYGLGIHENLWRTLKIEIMSRTTVRSILKEHGIEPAPDRAEPVWDQILKRHASPLWSCDFFHKKVLTPIGIKQYTTLVFIHVESRKIIVTKVLLNTLPAIGCAESPSASR
tara:strand:+ start:147247 stop:147681 length:435 start_codon:yes stop_codon:yes gene_type:complete